MIRYNIVIVALRYSGCGEATLYSVSTVAYIETINLFTNGLYGNPLLTSEIEVIFMAKKSQAI